MKKVFSKLKSTKYVVGFVNDSGNFMKADDKEFDDFQSANTHKQKILNRKTGPYVDQELQKAMSVFKKEAFIKFSKVDDRRVCARCGKIIPSEEPLIKVNIGTLEGSENSCWCESCYKEFIESLEKPSLKIEPIGPYNDNELKENAKKFFEKLNNKENE